jgi:hypothetical protein
MLHHLEAALLMAAYLYANRTAGKTMYGRFGAAYINWSAGAGLGDASNAPAAVRGGE